MSRAPWFKFYAGDYLNDPDVDRLPLEAQGVLLRMWAVSWLEGRLPCDVEELARKCKVRLPTMQLHVDLLMQFFVKQADNTYISERMERERQRCNNVSQSRSEAANKRWKKGVNASAHARRNAVTHAKHDTYGDAVRSQKSEIEHNLPPTPLPGGLEEDWRKVKQLLKDDFGTSFVNSSNFQECAYDRYFRDASIVVVSDDTILLAAHDMRLLREGIQKFGSRLSTTFKKVSGRGVRFAVFEEESA